MILMIIFVLYRINIKQLLSVFWWVFKIIWDLFWIVMF